MQENSAFRGVKSPDEVDLLAVFISVVNFFRRNGNIFLISCAFGLLLGGTYFALKSKVFESKMVAECMSLPDTRVVDLLLVLDQLRENEDWKQLGKKLNIKPSDAALIKEILPLSSVTVDKEAKGVEDYLLPTAETSYLFSVMVKVKDNRILPLLQDGLVYYLSNNEFSKLRVGRFKENRENLIKFIDQEMKKLDSLNSIFATRMINSKTSESTLTGPGDYKALLVQLQEKKLTHEDELKYASPVRIFQGFTSYPNPVEPIMKYCILLGFFIGTGFGFIFILIRDLRNSYIRNSGNYQ